MAAPGIKLLWVGYGDAVVAHAPALGAGNAESLLDAARQVQAKSLSHGKFRFQLGRSVNGSVIRQGSITVGALSERVAPAEIWHFLSSHQNLWAPLVHSEEAASPHLVALLRDALANFNGREILVTPTPTPHESEVRNAVSEVKATMLSNFEKVLDRGENLSVVADKTERLQLAAESFRQHSRLMRRRLWMQRCKLLFLIAVGILGIAFVIFPVACRGFSCTYK